MVTAPTYGFDTNTIHIGKKDLFINEAGSAMIANWPKFWAESRSIIFVVDLANTAQLADA